VTALPPGSLGPAGLASSPDVIGEVTEAIHKRLLDRWDGEPQPRIEEDLSFTPKDREQVLYVYMYRIAQNPNLLNNKRFREAPLDVDGDTFLHRPPLLVDLFYCICVHARFRSEAERLLGWAMLALHDTGQLIYRPRRFRLPDGREVDSLGETWTPDVQEQSGQVVEKISLALVDDLTVGDAVNLFTISEAPWRPFLTYRARVALDGPLVAAGEGATIRMPRPETMAKPPPTGPRESPSGRITGGSTKPPRRTPPGPTGHDPRPLDSDPESED